MRLHLLGLMGVLGASLSGCLTFSSFQTADTLKPGHGSFFVGAGYQQYSFIDKSEDEATKEIQTKIEKVKVPMIEYGLRYGLREDLDIGLRTGLFGSWIGDVKYRLSQTPETSMAAGAGLSYSNILDIQIVDFSVPFYMSYNLSRTNQLYLVPRAIFRRTTYDRDYLHGNEVVNSTVAGATVGIASGDDVQIFGEISYFGGPSEVDREGIAQAMIGINFGADNLDRFEHGDHDQNPKRDEKPAARREKRKGS